MQIVEQGEIPQGAERLSSPPDMVWLLPGVALGSRPYAYQRQSIVALGIRVVIALHEPSPEEPAAWRSLGLRLVSVPTPDWVEIPIDVFDRAVQEVDACLQVRQPVLLHCLAGLNRAPTVSAAVLCHQLGMDVATALAAVHRVRPAAKPTPEQERSLRRWQARRCQ